MLSVAAAVVGVAVASQFMGTGNSVRMEGPDGHEYDMQNLPNKEEAVTEATVCNCATEGLGDGVLAAQLAEG